MARVTKNKPTIKEYIKWWLNYNKEMILGGTVFLFGITCLIISSLAVKLIME